MLFSEKVNFLTDDSSLSDPNGFRMAGQPMIPMLPVMMPGQPGLQSPGAADPGFPRMMGPGNVVYPKGPYPQLQQMPAQFVKMNQQVGLLALPPFLRPSLAHSEHVYDLLVE